VRTRAYDEPVLRALDLRHRLHGVGQEIEEDLLQLVDVDHRLRRYAIHVAHEPDSAHVQLVRA
jgi:hypothetical protein